jgi:hypothetical protein
VLKNTVFTHSPGRGLIAEVMEASTPASRVDPMAKCVSPTEIINFLHNFSSWGLGAAQTDLHCLGQTPNSNHPPDKCIAPELFSLSR